mgnify:CR=1 FL=1
MSTAEQYELNKNLAQMLKGGVIMDVTTPEQAKLQKKPAHAPSWHSNGFLPTSVQPAAFPA